MHVCGFCSLDAFKFYFFKDLWYLSHSVFLYQKSLCLEYNSSVGFLKMRLDMILKPLCHKLCPMEALTMLCSHWLKSSAVEARLMTFGSILTRWFSYRNIPSAQTFYLIQRVNEASLPPQPLLGNFILKRGWVEVTSEIGLTCDFLSDLSREDALSRWRTLLCAQK